MDRSDVVKRLLYPKCKSAVEFNFDTLIVNPLLTYLTVQDIYQLNKIATSIKYSSKPKEKYSMIDKILIPRGFKKMASGTNRVVYRFLNDYRIVLKVAIDKVGLSDNGNEYRVQHLLKPFVTKCFEVSPCGTVGLFERVVPITSREEFVNISEDIFHLINNLIGKYVLEDIGEKYYMNYGLREGFGPVLLDYPYVFELDGRKLICNVQDPLLPNGYCGGEIDYDIGYNNLICTKCGKRYLATELKSEDKNKPKIIIKGEDSIMKCRLKRGDEVVAKLNSESHTSTNVIKPKKEFSKLKTKISEMKEEEENERKFPNIKKSDDVNLKVRLVNRNNQKFKNIDAEAIRKEEENKRNSHVISVSYKDSVKEEPKETSNLKVKIHSDEEETPIIPTDVANEIMQINMSEIKAEKCDSKVEEDDGGIKVIIQGIKIIDVKTNTIIGYTEDHVDSLNRFIDSLTSDPAINDKESTNEESENVYSNDSLQSDEYYQQPEYSEYENEYDDDSDEDDYDTPYTDEDYNDVVETVYSDEGSGSFNTTLADKLKGLGFNGSDNPNYRTDKITTPVENHYSKKDTVSKEVLDQF